MDLLQTTAARRRGGETIWTTSGGAAALLSVVLAFVAACAPVPGDEGDGAVIAPPPAAETRAEAPRPAAASELATLEPRAEDSSAPEPAPRQPVRARHDMVAAGNPLAAEAGRAMLRAGGTAMDAAIAAEFVLNVVEPQSSGIGGGGFLVYFGAKSGDIAAYDGRETAPARAAPGMFLDATGKAKTFHAAAVGGLSVGVPGLLRMLELAHRKHGRLPWARLFEPAIALAERGFPVSRRLHEALVRETHMRDAPAAAAYFYPGGEPLAEGATITNPDLAATFRLVAAKGAKAFYSGEVARDIVRAVRGHPTNPGGMTAADLAAYRAKRRDTVCLFYRLWLACGMPPPSSGGVTTLQILGILQSFDLAALEPASAEAIHLVAEASRLAFADRNTYVADPDFIPVPVAGMLDPGYLALRAREISPARAMAKAQPGMPGVTSGWRLAPDDTDHGISTTHLSVIDADGNAAAMTSSIETVFGSRQMVRGFLLNNQLTDFSFLPEKNGVPVANRVEPRKRPRSSMAPILVFDGRGRVILALGSPGGSRIIGYVTKTLIAALDWKQDIQAAIEMPHFLNRNGPTEIEAGSRLEALRPALEKLGHTVDSRPMPSGLQGVAVSGRGLAGGADPRRDGAAMGD